MLLSWCTKRILRSRRALSVVGGIAALLACSVAQAIDVEVQLVCDLTGTCGEGDFFFDHPEALETLNFAARAFEPFADSLSPVTVSPVATFQNPDGSESGPPTLNISNLAVPANTVIVYAGAHDLADNRVGEAGPGTPLGAFNRGQGVTTGAGAVDFAPWGGAIAFDTTASNGADRNWHFDIQERPAPGKVDFLTVALHELGHLFGFGTANSYFNQIVGSEFTGTTSATLFGGNVPLFTDQLHWDDGVTSPPYENEPRVAFGRSLVLGRRTLLSSLDYAALADIGWEVPSQLLGLQGNSDGDADVDGGDFLAWQRGIGMSNIGALQGDLSGDTTVDDYDLWLWAQNFGATLAAPAAASSAIVPEPSTAVLFALAGGTWWAVRGRRSLFAA